MPAVLGKLSDVDHFAIYVVRAVTTKYGTVRFYVGYTTVPRRADRLREHNARRKTWLAPCGEVTYLAGELGWVDLGFVERRVALLAELAHWCVVTAAHGIGRTRGGPFTALSVQEWEARNADEYARAREMARACPDWRASQGTRASAFAYLRACAVDVARVAAHLRNGRVDDAPATTAKAQAEAKATEKARAKAKEKARQDAAKKKIEKLAKDLKDRKRKTQNRLRNERRENWQEREAARKKVAKCAAKQAAKAAKVAAKLTLVPEPRAPRR